MSRYETEEEQVEAIKSWWKKNGTQLLTGLLVIAVAFSGWRYWNHQNQVKSMNASALFEVMQMNLQQGTYGEVSREGLKLIQEQPESPYAAAAAMMLAKYSYEKGEFDTAKQHLEWVRSHAQDDSIKQVATLRLARLLADKQEFSSAQGVLNQVNKESLLPAEKAGMDYVSGLIALGQANLSDAADGFRKVVNNPDASKTLQGIAQIQLDDLPH
ncbi:YfgM family protein [Thiomicrorhabdus chilensis]|uniref:YfgM family protein n=1 Tax=Thiomicrorhabdus chilensis TaxID=63656 RepID=UPI0003F6DF0F|nr:tetratricopeptide repeat protein [Thiomicrorhabdus chilensis]